MLTADEFSRLPDPPDGSKQELVRGEIITVPPTGFRHGKVHLNTVMLINDQSRSNKSGRVVVESGVQTERDPDIVRGPDVSYWSSERLPAQIVPEGYPEGTPDLAAEIRSPDQSLGKLRAKAKEFIAAGVRLVWLIDPDARAVTVVRRGRKERVLDEHATLDGEDVLPGFSCKVTEFFA
ncbi:MAG: Uma2 family endonuclease [Gemmataceae bacterium]